MSGPVTIMSFGIQVCRDLKLLRLEEMLSRPINTIACLFGGANQPFGFGFNI